MIKKVELSLQLLIKLNYYIPSFYATLLKSADFLAK